MAAIRWQSAADVIVLALAIYLLLRWSREARALRLAVSILALRVAALLTRQLNLLITTWVLDAATIVALLILVIAFQPELRRAVMRMDLFGRAAPERRLPVWAAVAAAAGALAETRCGALIVVVQEDSIAELVTGGITLGARVSPEILQAIFQKSSPIHDGAAIIEGDQLVSARVLRTKVTTSSGSMRPRSRYRPVSNSRAGHRINCRCASGRRRTHRRRLRRTSPAQRRVPIRSASSRIHSTPFRRLPEP